MICYECGLNSICAINSTLLKYANEAVIEIKSCKHFKDPGVVATSAAAPVNIDPLTGRKMIDREKLNELSKQAEEQQKKEIVNKPNTPKPKLIVEPLKLDATCSECGCNTWAEDIRKCEECGGPTCSNCATIGAEDGKILCQKCWSAL